MNYLLKILVKIQAWPVHDLPHFPDLLTSNVRRSRVVMGIMAPIHAIHCLLFYFIEAGTAKSTLWKTNLFFAHLTMLGIVIFLILISIYMDSLKVRPSIRIIPVYFLIFLYLSFGAYVSAIDQLITTSITPFLVATIGSAFIFLMPPAVSLLLYSLALTLLIVFTATTQPSQEILLSIRLNGLTESAVGFSLSWALWIMRLRDLSNVDTIRNQQKKLEEKNTELIRLNAIRDRLFSIIAHDLRLPLSTSAEILHLISTEGEVMDETEKRDVLDRQARTLQLSYEFVDNLLVWSRSNLNEIPFTPTALNPHKIANISFELYNQNNRNITAINKIPEDLTINGDPEMIGTIFRNLTSNALKASSSGDNVEFNYIAHPNMHEFSVADTGKGISPEILNNLFQLSIHAENYSRRERTTGLGLLLCREFVEQHGGKIYVASKPDTGTKISFTIQKTYT